METVNRDHVKLQSAVAKAVNGRSAYQKPLLERLAQMVETYDRLDEENQDLKLELAHMKRKYPEDNTDTLE